VNQIVSKYLGIAQAIVDGVVMEGGQFIRSGNSVYILIGGRRIVVSPDFTNTAYAAVQIKHSGVATAEAKGRAICQFVAVLGGQQATDMRLAKFSAVSKNKCHLYVPIEGGSLLEISSEGMREVVNGANGESLWLEHPQGRPFEFTSDVDVQKGLQRFEELLVKTQACTSSSQRWLVAMHEGLMPYVREYVAARMLVEHTGPSQHGKTSGAQRFSKLHGLGEVMGDVSTAYLRNSCDGIGLMVLDNKEQASYGPDLISFLLFTATGARHGRSTQDGSAREMTDRPIGVLTSIEGLYKQELQKRTISIPYGALQKGYADRDYIEEMIERDRDVILSALCHVLQQFLATEPSDAQKRLEALPICPWPEFQGYIRVLARLLYAYATVRGWALKGADKIIGNWFKTLGRTATERDDDVIETHVCQALDMYEAVLDKKEYGGDMLPTHTILLKAITRVENYEYMGRTGRLYITSASQLLAAMRANNIGVKDLPKNASGMGRRLDSGDWGELKVLKESDDKHLLSRTSDQRKIGIFRPGEPTMQAGAYAPTKRAPVVHPG
jgi:hypothetical protein